MNNTFGKNILPENEEFRVKALQHYDVISNLPNRYFNNLAHIIAKTFDTPIALITIVAEKNVLFKGNAGMEGVDEADRGISLCSLAILDPEPTIFTNALQEPCLLSNPHVAGDFGLRFYAGAPITTPDGFHLGTVCVIDKAPRAFSEADKDLLVQFARSVMTDIADRQKHTIEARPQ